MVGHVYCQRMTKTYLTWTAPTCSLKLPDNFAREKKKIFEKTKQIPIISSSSVHRSSFDMICDMIYLLTVIGLTRGGSNVAHIYTQTIHRTTQLTTLVGMFSRIRTQSGQTKINDELTA